MQRNLLDLFAVQGIHGHLGLVMMIHDDETTASRGVINCGQDHGMSHSPVASEDLGEFNSEDEVRVRSAWLLQGSEHAYLVRSKGSPSTYRFRRMSDCFPPFAIRGMSEGGAAVTALKLK